MGKLKNQGNSLIEFSLIILSLAAVGSLFLPAFELSLFEDLSANVFNFAEIGISDTLVFGGYIIAGSTCLMLLSSFFKFREVPMLLFALIDLICYLIIYFQVSSTLFSFCIAYGLYVPFFLYPVIIVLCGINLYVKMKQNPVQQRNGNVQARANNAPRRAMTYNYNQPSYNNKQRANLPLNNQQNQRMQAGSRPPIKTAPSSNQAYYQPAVNYRQHMPEYQRQPVYNDRQYNNVNQYYNNQQYYNEENYNRYYSNEQNYYQTNNYENQNAGYNNGWYYDMNYNAENQNYVSYSNTQSYYDPNYVQEPVYQDPYNQDRYYHENGEVDYYTYLEQDAYDEQNNYDYTSPEQYYDQTVQSQENYQQYDSYQPQEDSYLNNNHNPTYARGTGSYYYEPYYV